MSQVIAKRYAQALYELSEESKKVEAVFKDVINLKECIAHSEELRRFLNNPTLPSDLKRKIFNDLFKSRISPLTFSFLNFLESKSRTSILPDVCITFEKIYFKQKNILPIKITSRIKLNKNQVSSISHHLKLKMRKEIDANLIVDEEMLGGIKIQMEDIVHDYSIRAQLKKFRESLIQS